MTAIKTVYVPRDYRSLLRELHYTDESWGYQPGRQFPVDLTENENSWDVCTKRLLQLHVIDHSFDHVHDSPTSDNSVTGNCFVSNPLKFSQTGKTRMKDGGKAQE